MTDDRSALALEIVWLRTELRSAVARCRYDLGYEEGVSACRIEGSGQRCHCQAVVALMSAAERTGFARIEDEARP